MLLLLLLFTYLVTANDVLRVVNCDGSVLHETCLSSIDPGQCYRFDPPLRNVNAFQITSQSDHPINFYTASQCGMACDNFRFPFLPATLYVFVLFFLVSYTFFPFDFFFLLTEILLIAKSTDVLVIRSSHCG